MKLRRGKIARFDFKGFTNLSSLCLGNCKSLEKTHPVLEALYQGEFPALHSLQVYFSNLRIQEVCRIVEAILHGNLQQVKSLDLMGNDLRDEAVDALIEVIPHLEVLNVRTNSISDVGVRRLRFVAKQYPNVRLLGWWSQFLGERD